MKKKVIIAAIIFVVLLTITCFFGFQFGKQKANKKIYTSSEQMEIKNISEFDVMATRLKLINTFETSGGKTIDITENTYNVVFYVDMTKVEFSYTKNNKMIVVLPAIQYNANKDDSETRTIHSYSKNSSTGSTQSAFSDSIKREQDETILVENEIKQSTYLIDMAKKFAISSITEIISHSFANSEPVSIEVYFKEN